MEWQFRYRAYKKQRCIQLKPIHDKEKHFSIIWSRSKNDISVEEFNIMDEKIRELLENKNYVLQLILVYI